MSLGSDQLKGLLDAVRNIITGETARAIGYGGAAIIYIVAKAVGVIPDQTPEAALTEAGAALVVVGSFVESIRRFVYSQNTVTAILDEQKDTDVPTSDGDTT